MHITNAFWEERNLGVTTQEVEIEETDSIDDFEEAVSNLTAEYLVVKIPVSRLDINKLLSDKGFTFVESSIRVSNNLKEGFCPSIIKRFSNEVVVDLMEESDFSFMNDQIDSGMFKTDRVILDPFFTADQAARRYKLWLKDERDRGSVFHVYKYKNEPFGFTCMKETQKSVVYPLLGGVYSIDRSLPLGSVIVYKQLEVARSLEAKSLYTYISTNNSTVVRVYSQLGYIFEDLKYVFVKHTENER